MMNEADLLRTILHQAIINHGVDWRIESDWAYEIIAADDYCVAKCWTEGDALALIYRMREINSRIRLPRFA